MKSLHVISAFLVMAVPSVAVADEADAFDRRMPAISDSLELGVGGGYSQGVGGVAGDSADLHDLAGPGGGAELHIGYRVHPNVMVGAYGTLAAQAEGDLIASGTEVTNAAAGIEGMVHIRPDRSVDPWVSLGTGWRGLWLTPDRGETTSLQGLQLARLQAGVDYRVSDTVALAPAIGASLGMFLARDDSSTTEHVEIADKEVNVTFFAGLQGRFEI